MAESKPMRLGFEIDAETGKEIVKRGRDLRPVMSKYDWIKAAIREKLERDNAVAS